MTGRQGNPRSNGTKLHLPGAPALFLAILLMALALALAACEDGDEANFLPGATEAKGRQRPRHGGSNPSV